VFDETSLDVSGAAENGVCAQKQDNVIGGKQTKYTSNLVTHQYNKVTEISCHY
jgi:hypothetical protein